MKNNVIYPAAFFHMQNPQARFIRNQGWRVGQANDTPIVEDNPPETFGTALRQITPTLIIVGIATGAAFAIGSGLVHRYVFKGR